VSGQLTGPNSDPSLTSEALPMNHPIAAILLLASGFLGDDPPGSAPGVEATRASRAGELARAEAGLYRVEVGGGSKRAAELRPESVLRWSNPVAGSIHGEVFVWTDRGRPAAIGSIYKWSSPNTHLGVELHALTTEPISADRRGRRVWSPGPAEVARRPIPGAPSPADSPAARLRQLRTLAQEFAAAETTREGVSRELRLLTRPIYRSESTNPEVIDGGLFVFVEGTDPEVILIIEAIRGPSGPEWRYAAARLNSIELRLNHKGREAWNAPVVPWAQAGDHAKPYTLFIYGSDPGITADGP